MPELPEVEEVRRGLEAAVMGGEIVAIAVRRRDYVRPGAAVFAQLRGRRLVSTHRHGKKLFITVDDGKTLHVHLGMSGRVDIVPATEPVAVHTHVILTLKDGRDVRFRDPRRFGEVVFYPTFRGAIEGETGGLGPDALGVTGGQLGGWRGAKGYLKQRLLGQKDIAGLGNIYVDEALWMCGLHPRQRVGRIREDKLGELVLAIREVLEKSIASGGTTLRDYRNVSNQPGAFKLQLQAYGRGGEACRRCGKVMQEGQVAGRTTVWCAGCQKKR